MAIFDLLAIITIFLIVIAAVMNFLEALEEAIISATPTSCSRVTLGCLIS